MDVWQQIGELWAPVWDFFGIVENRERATAIATVVAAGVPILGGGFWIFGKLVQAPFKRAKPERSEPAAQVAVATPEPMAVMTLAQFEQRQEALRDKITQKLQQAHDADRALLQAELDAVNARLREPEKALQEAQKRVADLEAQLDREANRFGAEKIDEAKRALRELDFSKAEELFSVVRADAQIGVDAAARAEFGLGEIAEARVRWGEAAQHYARAAELAPDFGRLKKASEFAWRAGDYPAALRWGAALVAVAREGGSQTELAEALNANAATLQDMGRYDEAEPLYRQALEIDRATIGEGHPGYAIRLNNLAALLQAMGRYDEAEPLYRQALEIDRATLGEGHPDYATDLNNLAELLRAMGRHDEAEPLYRQALEIDRATIGEGHPDYATRLNNLAGLLQDTGRYDEAEPLYRQALEIDRAVLGEGHPGYASGLNNLAELLRAMGRYDEAEPLYRQALEIGKATIGEGHPNYAGGLNNLAGLLWAMGRYDEAEPLAEQAVAIFEATLPVGHPHIAIARETLVATRAAKGK